MDLELFCVRAIRSVRTSVHRNLFFLLAVLSGISPLAGAQSAPVAIVGIPSQLNLDSVGIPNAPPSGNAPTDYFPDGHLSVLWDTKMNTSQIFWAESQSWGSFGSDVPSATNAYATLGVQPANGQWGDGPTTSGDRSNPSSFYNSGSWLYSAFKVDKGTFNLNPNSDYMIGFFHGEDHWYTDQGTTNSYYHDPVSWRAIGLATSSDGGLTWTREGMIIGVPTLKPQYPSPFSPSIPHPPYGGIGDHSAVLDNHSNPDQPAWVVFFPMIGSNGLENYQGIGAARTTDPNAAPGSWYAYYNGSFGIPQLTNQSLNSSLPGLNGNPGSDYDQYSLSNPSVHWNTTLNRWVLIAATWDLTKILISYSNTADVTEGWSEPSLVYSAPSGKFVKYPTIVGTDHLGHLSDTESGPEATLYWAQFDAAGVVADRRMMSAPLGFGLGTTPAMAVTPSASTITTTQALTVTVGVSAGTGNPTPTGTVTLKSGSYSSASTLLSSGSATINVPAGSLATGSDTLILTYSGDTNYKGNSSTTTVTVVEQPSCGNVQLQLTPDYSYAIGGSDGGTSYSFALGGTTLAQGPMTQLNLFHFDSSFASTSGTAPVQTVGASRVPGKFGSGVEVSSGGTLSYEQPGNLSTQDGTIEMWISPQYDGTNAVYSNPNGEALFSYWGGSAANALTLATGGSGNSVYLFAGASGIYAGYTAVSGFAGWKAGEWHHLAMTYSTSQSRLRLYLDGVLVQEHDGTIAISGAAGGTFSIASGYGNATAFVVDEVRITNNEMLAGAIAFDASRTSAFANNEVYLPLAGVTPGQLTYSVGSCGSVSLTYTGIPITNLSPFSGLLPPGSTSVPISFNTIQPTLCRYSVGTAPAYASMQPLDTGSAATVHSGTIPGLSSDPRVLNQVYLRCASNQDFLESLVYRDVAVPTEPFPRIGSIWQGEYILTTKPDEAAKIQVFFAPGGMSAAQAIALRAQNPTVLIIPSVNAQETTGGSPSVPSSYLLHDVNGNPISDWPGNYLLNMTMPEVANVLAQYAVNLYLSTPNLAYDGLFWDNFNTSIPDPYYDYMGVPHQISSANNGVADDPTVLNAKWSAGIYTLITNFNQLAPNAYVAAHNAAPVPMNFANFNGVSSTMDAPNVIEGTEPFGQMFGNYNAWFLNGRQPVISAIQSAPPSQIAYGYGYNPINNVTPSVLQFSQTYYPYMRFGLATALMNNGFSIFDYGDNQSPVNWWYDEFDFNLGQPLGPAYQAGGASASNLLLNSGFENGLTDWSFIVDNQDKQAQATIALDTTSFVEGKTSAHIDVISAGTADWHVDLEQPNVSLTAGKTYQMTFWARADQPRSITVNSQGGAPSYPNYGLNSQIPIGTMWKVYSASFVAPVTAADGRIQFFAGDVAGNVWIDNVQLTQVSGVYRRDFTDGVVLLNGTPAQVNVSLESGLQRFTGNQAPLWQYIVDDVNPDFTADSSWQTVTYESGSFHDGHYQPPYYHAWNSTAHLQSTSGTAAQWNLKIPADGQYTIQVWLPAAPGASGWTKSAVYEVVSGTTVLASTTIDQTAASSGDAWHSIAMLSLTVTGAPFLRVHNGGSGSLIADAIYVTSAARYNDGSTASEVALAPFDGILLKRQTEISVPASITIQTNPAGLIFSVDGTEQTAPATLNLAPGSHTISVLPTQVDAPGTQYVFSSWSDGGAASHTIAVGSSSATYTANFQTQYQLAVSTSPANGGTASPVSGSFYNAGTAVNISATPNKGYVFAGWTGNVASASSARTTVTMSAPEAITATFGQSVALQFIPVTPCRVADTRNATGPFGGPELSAGSSREFDISRSACGIPSTAAAYSLNVTVVPSKTLDYLTLWPTGETQPLVSTLNSLDGRIKANAAIVPAGTNGGVRVYVSDATNVILDIDGYFVSTGTTSALAFYPLTPCRIADTRNPSGPLGGTSITGGSSRAFPILSSNCGIPSTAEAYSLNVTAVPHKTLNYLTTWPTGETQPNVSTLNAPTGTIVANAAIVPAGSSGEVSIFVSDTADVILDTNGYFAPPATGGLSLYTVTPCRVLDTRGGAGVFNGVFAEDVETSSCAPPSTAQAYVLNATVVPPGSLNYLTLWPAGETQPYVSTLNADDGAITSNMAILPTTNGSIDAFSSNPTNLILDLSSYFAP